MANGGGGQQQRLSDGPHVQGAGGVSGASSTSPAAREEGPRQPALTVCEQDVLEVVSESLGVPLARHGAAAATVAAGGAVAAASYAGAGAQGAGGLEAELGRAVVGQGAAVRAVGSVLRLWQLGLHVGLGREGAGGGSAAAWGRHGEGGGAERPLASFVFVGPSGGVGRSTLCKVRDAGGRCSRS